MIDYQDLFHLGVRVPDLEAAMAEIGAGSGVTWSEVREADGGQQLWTPDNGVQNIPLRYTYSAEGPQHIELLEGAADSFWDGRDHPGAHHVGVWADDVAGETQRMIDAGWTLVGAHMAPDDGFGIFTYVQPPSGLIVELVDRRVLPAFEAWWGAALQ